MILYYFSLFLSWLTGIGICSILVYYSYQAYILVDHFEKLEDQSQREGIKALQKMMELEVLRYRIERLTNP